MLHVMTENVKNEETPRQPFPDKPHLFYLIELLRTQNRLLVPKTRQMTVTWVVCAFFLHRMIFFPSRLIFFSSKKELDAEAMCERTKYMYDGLPRWMKNISPVEKKHCKLISERNRSQIIGVPAGADQLRSYTPTDIFADEAAFQDELRAMLAAAIPAIGHRGRIVLASSASPSFFSDLVFDT